MGRLYKRKVYVTIGQEVGKETLIINPNTLRVVFEVTKTVTSQPNSVRCQLYNLNRASRALVNTPGNIITIKAGYEDDLPDGSNANADSLPIISRADFIHSHHQRMGSDFITSIEAAEGNVAYRAAFLNEKVSPGANIIQVFSLIKESFKNSQLGITGAIVDRGFSVVPNYNQIITNSTTEAKAAHLAKATVVYDKFFKNGLTLYGFSREILDKLAIRHDLVWFFDNNVLTVAPITGFIESGQSGPWGPYNGVQGIPVRLEDGSVQTQMNLNPSVSAWSKQTLQMEIEEEFNGDYKVYRIQHVGDTHPRGKWTSTWEGVQVG